MSWVHKFDSTVDEGKGRLIPSRDKKLRQAPQKEGGEILCDLPPGRCIQMFTERCSLTFRMNGTTKKKKKKKRV